MTDRTHAHFGVSTKFGPISSMWEMNDDDRRIAIMRKASKGASKLLRHRDVIEIDTTPQRQTPLLLLVPDRAPAWKRILFEVAIKHNIEPTLILGQQRSRLIVAARHELYFRLSSETQMSLSGIGRKLNRDHTTIMAGIAAHKRRTSAAAIEVKS